LFDFGSGDIDFDDIVPTQPKAVGSECHSSNKSAFKFRSAIGFKNRSGFGLENCFGNFSGSERSFGASLGAQAHVTTSEGELLWFI